MHIVQTGLKPTAPGLTGPSTGNRFALPTIILVHHGPTIFDADEGRKERVQSWSQLPITEHGESIVKQTASELRAVPVWWVMSSGIKRAAMTAEIIAKALGVQHIAANNLRPSHSGVLIGQLAKDVKPLMKWFSQHVDVAIPRGENKRQFIERWGRGLKYLMSYADANSGKAVVAVIHSQNFATMNAVLTGDTTIYEKQLEPGYGKMGILQHQLDGNWTYTILR